MGFDLGNGLVFNATTRTPYLHHAVSNSMSLDLFGTLWKRTGRKAYAICRFTWHSKVTVAFPLSILKMAFASVLGWIGSAKAKTRKLCLRLGDSNSTSLDLFGTRTKRTGRKAFGI